MSILPDKIDLLKLADNLGDREEKTVSTVEDLNVCVTSYLGEYLAHRLELAFHPKNARI